MSALSALPPPPPSDCYTKETSFCVCGARSGRQAAKECDGVWLGRIAARRTLYHTFVLVCGGGLTEGVHPKMGASFWLPLGSYTGMLSPLLWTTPNLGCTPHRGRAIANFGIAANLMPLLGKNRRSDGLISLGWHPIRLLCQSNGRTCPKTLMFAIALPASGRSVEAREPVCYNDDSCAEKLRS